MILLYLEKLISDTIVPGRGGGFLCLYVTSYLKLILNYIKNIIVYINVAVAVLNKIIVKNVINIIVYKCPK